MFEISFNYWFKYCDCVKRDINSFNIGRIDKNDALYICDIIVS